MVVFKTVFTAFLVPVENSVPGVEFVTEFIARNYTDSSCCVIVLLTVLKCLQQKLPQGEEYGALLTTNSWSVNIWSKVLNKANKQEKLVRITVEIGNIL